MDTNNLFDNYNKNIKEVKGVDNNMRKGRVLVVDLLIDIFFTILISILVMAFPFLWIIGGLSGTSLGVVAPFIGLIVLMVLIYIYARWKKSQKIKRSPADIKKTRFTFSVIVVICFIVFAIFFVNLFFKSQKSQKEYNEFSARESTRMNEIVKKNQPVKNAKGIKMNMESKIAIIEKCINGGGFVSEPGSKPKICSKRSVTNSSWFDIKRYNGEWGGCEFIIEKNNNNITNLQFCATLASGEVVKCTQKGCVGS